MNEQAQRQSGTSDYRLTSRRPIADGFRRSAQWAVRVCLRADIHPDVISYCSILAAGAAAACFWQAGAHPWLLLPAVFVIITVLAFNFLGDGLRDAADPYK